MTADTDTEFVEALVQIAVCDWDQEQFDRFLALARRGVEAYRELSSLRQALRETTDENMLQRKALRESTDEILGLRAALRPFEHLANVAHPAAIDTLLGAGFFKHLENARAALEDK